MYIDNSGKRCIDIAKLSYDYAEYHAMQLRLKIERNRQLFQHQMMNNGNNSDTDTDEYNDVEHK